MKLKLALFLIFLASSLPVVADVKANGRTVKFKNFGFSVGSLTEFVGNVQIDSNGKRRTIDLNPTVGVLATIPIEGKFDLLPEINWVLPRKTGEDKVYKNLFMFRADIGYRWLEWLRLRVGTSVMFLNTHGSGGKVTRDNGNDKTEFYRPNSNSSSFNNTFDVGVEAIFEDKWALRVQNYTYALFNNERRQHSYMIMGSYYWDYKKTTKK